MSLVVRTNMAAIRQLNQFNASQDRLANSVEKIASGLRIRESADDAAGLGLASPMQTKNVSLRQSMRNINDGVSLLQTAEGTLNEIGNILARMRELSVQSSNGTYSDSDRSLVNTEFVQMRNEIRRIASNAVYNGVSLLAGTGSGSINIQAGIFQGSDNQIKISREAISASQGVLAISTLTVETRGNAQHTIDRLDTAIESVLSSRTSLGSIQNTLESAINEASSYSEKLSASYSQIMDLDYAEESSNVTRYQIMQQTGIASFGQAKDLTDSVVNLLG